MLLLGVLTNAFLMGAPTEYPSVKKEGYTESQTCGVCHTAIYKEWKNSLHASSISDPVFLGVFNLFPIAPLDGSKLLFALLPYHLRYIEEFMMRNQLFLVLILVFFGGNIIQTSAYAVLKIILGVNIL